MDEPIMMPDMCQKHQYLVRQAGYSEHDPWRALVIASQIALFQAMTTDDRVYEKVGGDVKKIASLGCFACYKPDAFGEIVQAAQTGDIKAIKELGERWVKAKAKS